MNKTTSLPTTIPSPSTPSDSRLYVGNLSPAVDEFALVALFSKFGKISKLDFLFHKSGILRGKPRGYAFIEMNRRDEALKAMIELNNKPVRGKRILVTPANESQYQEHQAANQPKPNHQHSHQNHSNHHSQRGGRPVGPDPMRPTTLSILKSQQLPKGVNNKIAALEAKLASMQHSQTPSTTSSINPASSTSVPTPPTKPSFLPENPTTFRSTGVNGNGSHTNQLLGGRTLSNNLSKSSTSSSSSFSANNKNGPRNSLVRGTKLSRNLVSSGAMMKNPTNLEAIGLTLKEQLKRNRETKLLNENLNTSRVINTGGKAELGQLDEKVSNFKQNNDNKPLSIIPSPDDSGNCSNKQKHQTQELASSNPNIKEEEQEAKPELEINGFKRQKIDHVALHS